MSLFGMGLKDWVKEVKFIDFDKENDFEVFEIELKFTFEIINNPNSFLMTNSIHRPCGQVNEWFMFYLSE